MTADYISAQSVRVAVDDTGVAIAFAALEQQDEGAVLEHFWVLPTYIGKGLGKRLFSHVAARASEFTVTSDPHADDFYRKTGARKIGREESAFQGRSLSKFRFRAQA